MEALRFSYKNRSLEYKRVKIPEILEPCDVLVKVMYAGVCNSDLRILEGDFPCTQVNDITLGHEISGTVSGVGYQVLYLRENDCVVVDPTIGCKKCTFCHAGQPHFCKLGCTSNTLGIYQDGGWAGYVLCPEEQVHKIPPKLSLEQAVLTEPLSCISHGWDLLNPVVIGQKVLVLDGGLCGCLWISLFHLHGHRDVTISEPRLNRFKLIRKLNTKYEIVTPEMLKNRFANDPDYQFDVIVDCSGSPSAIEFAFQLLRSGGKLYVNYTILGIKTFILEDYAIAIEAMKQGIITKAVFKLM